MKHLLGAGELNRRIILQAIVLTADSVGGYLESWVDICTISAKIESLSAITLQRKQEHVLAQQLQSEISIAITIRVRLNVSPTMRVKYGNRYYHITAVVNPNEGRERLILLCKECPA